MSGFAGGKCVGVLLFLLCHLLRMIVTVTVIASSNRKLAITPTAIPPLFLLKVEMSTLMVVLAKSSVHKGRKGTKEGGRRRRERGNRREGKSEEVMENLLFLLSITLFRMGYLKPFSMLFLVHAWPLLPSLRLEPQQTSNQETRCLPE